MALDCFAGCAGGAAGVLVGQPLDTVKVRLQTQCHQIRKYDGMMNCMVKIVKNESVRGLYKGMSAPLYGASLQCTVIFGVWGQVKPLAKKYGNNSMWGIYVAGALTGAIQSFIVSPLELIKTRLQMDESRVGTQQTKNKAWLVMKNIYWKEGGIRGIYKGLCPTLCREMPAIGTYFTICETMTKGGEKGGGAYLMLVGGIAGTVSWVGPCAVDVVKTRIQSDTAGRYLGMSDCIRKTYAEEGLIAFTRGLNSILLRAFILNSVVYAVYATILRYGRNSKRAKEK